MTSLEEKEKGAAAWSANNFPLAILHFSNAIEIGGEKEFIKVVYSNRSVANLKLNKLVEALADANKCIEIDAKWPKGYTRKGDALYSSKKYTDSFNAYNSAKKLSPSDQSIVEKCDLAMRAIGAEADRTAPSRPSTSGGSRSTATPTTAPPTGILGKIVTYSRYLLLLSAVLYLIPFGRSLSALSFRLFAIMGITINLVTLYDTFGMPKFTMEFAARIMQDPATTYLFLAVILVVTRPYMFAMAPILLIEGTNFTGPIFQSFRSNIPALEEQLKAYQPMLQRFMPAAAANIGDVAGFVSPRAETEFNFQLVRNAAMCEVMQGVFLIVEMILPTRNLSMIFLWWQYLQFRYMSDEKGHVKAAFSSLDQRISTVLAHRLCPKLVVRGYDALKKFLAQKVKPPQPPAAGAAAPSIPSVSSMLLGLKSKCSVM